MNLGPLKIVGMKPVILKTTDGRFVIRGQVPAFNQPPDVLVWGDRHFRYDSTDSLGADVYIECFAVALIQIDWELSRQEVTC